MDIRNKKIVKHSGLLLALCILALPGVTGAQQYYDPGILQKSIDRKPIEAEAQGVPVGTFNLKPGVEVVYEDNDNIFYMNEDEISDSIIHVRPWANLNSDWSRHALTLRAFADLVFYNDFGSQDYEDWVADLDGRIDVRRGSYFDYQAAYMQLHEERGDPDAFLSGIAPTEFSIGRVGAGYSHTFNRLDVGINFGTAQTDYDDNIAITGEIIDNQDRNRRQNSYGLSLDYLQGPQRCLFVSVQGNDIEYDQEFDSAGNARSSSGLDARAGIRWELTGVIVGDVYVSYVEQDYDDPSFGKIDGTGIGAGLDWTPTRMTNVNVRIANAVQETIQNDTSGYLSRLYSIRIQHDFRRNILGNLRFSYTDNDYQYNGTNPLAITDTEVTRAGIGLTYLLNRNFYLSCGYTYEKQEANNPLFDYERNRLFITLGAEL